MGLLWDNRNIFHDSTNVRQIIKKRCFCVLVSFEKYCILSKNKSSGLNPNSNRNLLSKNLFISLQDKSKKNYLRQNMKAT